jgi:hypothetical protein
MNKPSVALFAFVGGIVFATLTAPHVPSVSAAQNDEPPIAGRNIISGGIFSNLVHATGFGGAIPRFLPIEKTPVFMQEVFTNISAQTLDGLDCRGCTFNDANLEYGGGAFNLESPRFSGTTTLRLTGAAANTVALLKLFEDVDRDLPGLPAEFQQNKPIPKKASAKTTMTHMTVTAPYEGHM